MKISYVYLLSFVFSILCTNTWAQGLEFEKNAIAENRIDVNLSEFVTWSNHKLIESNFVEKSVKWVRNEANLLTPKVLVHLKFKDGLNQNKLFVQYKSERFFPTQIYNENDTNQKIESQIDLFVDLFNPSVIDVFEGSSKIDSILIESVSHHSDKGTKHNSQNKQLIDYSCAPYFLEILGVEDDYLSAGCVLEKVGEIGAEKPRLEVTFSSTNLSALNGSEPPFKIYLTNSHVARLELKNRRGEIKNLKIKAQLPDRLYRLKTAFGFGPYLYDSIYQQNIDKRELSISLMLYGKYDLTKSSSLKFFDAIVYPKTLFNNSGMYFSYDIADVFDGRIVINTLLGFQGIHFKQNTHTPLEFDMIFPQGFELTYKHAFNLENYNLIYGMFISNGEKDYSNLWIRFGEKKFYELNYISWKNKDTTYRTWGFSIGIPLWNAF